MDLRRATRTARFFGFCTMRSRAFETPSPDTVHFPNRRAGRSGAARRRSGAAAAPVGARRARRSREARGRRRRGRPGRARARARCRARTVCRRPPRARPPRTRRRDRTSRRPRRARRRPRAARPACGSTRARPRRRRPPPASPSAAAVVVVSRTAGPHRRGHSSHSGESSSSSASAHAPTAAQQRRERARFLRDEPVLEHEQVDRLAVRRGVALAALAGLAGRGRGAQQQQERAQRVGRALDDGLAAQRVEARVEHHRHARQPPERGDEAVVGRLVQAAHRLQPAAAVDVRDRRHLLSERGTRRARERELRFCSRRARRRARDRRRTSAARAGRTRVVNDMHGENAAAAASRARRRRRRRARRGCLRTIRTRAPRAPAEREGEGGLSLSGAARFQPRCSAARARARARARHANGRNGSLRFRRVEPARDARVARVAEQRAVAEARALPRRRGRATTRRRRPRRRAPPRRARPRARSAAAAAAAARAAAAASAAAAARARRPRRRRSERRARRGPTARRPRARPRARRRRTRPSVDRERAAPVVGGRRGALAEPEEPEGRAADRDAVVASQGGTKRHKDLPPRSRERGGSDERGREAGARARARGLLTSSKPSVSSERSSPQSTEFCATPPAAAQVARVALSPWRARSANASAERLRLEVALHARGERDARVAARGGARVAALVAGQRDRPAVPRVGQLVFARRAAAPAVGEVAVESERQRVQRRRVARVARRAPRRRRARRGTQRRARRRHGSRRFQGYQYHGARPITLPHAFQSPKTAGCDARTPRLSSPCSRSRGCAARATCAPRSTA